MTITTFNIFLGGVGGYVFDQHKAVPDSEAEGNLYNLHFSIKSGQFPGQAFHARPTMFHI